MPEPFRTVADVVQSYLAHAERSMEFSSLKAIRAIHRRFLAACGHFPLADVTDATFTDFIATQAGLQSPKTQAWALYQIRRPFRWAEGFLPPSVQLDLRDRRQRGPRRPPRPSPAPAPVPASPWQEALDALAGVMFDHPILRGRVYLDHEGVNGQPSAQKGESP